MLLGLLLVGIEPVFGVRLLGWALQAKPPLSTKEEKELEGANAKADDTRIEARAKVTEAKSKAAAIKAKTSLLAAAADMLMGFAGEKAVQNLAFQKKLAAQSKEEVVVVEAEADAAKAEATHASDTAERELMLAELKKEKRQLELGITEMTAAERVELIMATCEDGPEIILAILFIIYGGVDERCVCPTPFVNMAQGARGVAASGLLCRAAWC